MTRKPQLAGEQLSLDIGEAMASAPVLADDGLPAARGLEGQAPDDVLRLLDAWTAWGWLRPLDLAFARLLARLDPSAPAIVLLLATLASHQLAHGHVCLDLGAMARHPDEVLALPPEGERPEGRGDVPPPRQLLAAGTLAQWRQALARSMLVDVDGQGGAAPLVLQDDCLYLRRHWRDERLVETQIRARLGRTFAPPPAMAAQLDRLMGPAPAVPETTDWQRVACALATRAGFSIVTGGPGTGKTTTVIRLLALLQEGALAQGSALRIRLAAPTGKAAARLSASIAAQIATLDAADEVRRAIPSEVATLHRLLGRLPGTRRFRHDAANPLPLDVLVVDEASMIDLDMMARLLEALPLPARLVLLGDKDQLSSVEAGAVLGTLCRSSEAGRYTPDTERWLAEQAGARLRAPGLEPGAGIRDTLAQQVVMLRRSRRFEAGSGIGALAAAVNRQDTRAARTVLDAANGDLHTLHVRGDDLRPLAQLAIDGWPDGPPGYAAYLEQLRATRPRGGGPDDPAWSAWAHDILQAFDRFRILCAVRKGRFGVEQSNIRIAQALHARGLLDASQGWYEGRPVLVTRNDYGLGLMNGDIGIALRVPLPAADGAPPAEGLKVAFPRSDGRGVRFVLTSRLGDLDTVFAMTVHKSQGSEFAHTALVLPETASPVLTKELVYTGVTRARQWFTLVETGQGMLEEALGRKVARSGRLAV